jgi:hypothetical protein
MWTCFRRHSEPGAAGALSGRARRPRPHDAETAQRFAYQGRGDQRLNPNLDTGLVLPAAERGGWSAAYVPMSRLLARLHLLHHPLPARYARARSARLWRSARPVAQGVKEVTLLGQIVDRYGVDVPDGPHPGSIAARGA